MPKQQYLPPTIMYGGFKVQYVETTTFKASDCIWYRHEYAYVDMPHITECVYFFRTDDYDPPIEDVTGFTVSFDRESKRNTPPYIRRQRQQAARNRKKLRFERRLQRALSEAADDDGVVRPAEMSEAMQRKMAELADYAAQRKQHRDERREAIEDKKTSRDLSKRIRQQVKPFGGEK